MASGSLAIGLRKVVAAHRRSHRAEVVEQIERDYRIDELADAVYPEVDDGVAAFAGGNWGRG